MTSEARTTQSLLNRLFTTVTWDCCLIKLYRWKDKISDCYNGFFSFFFLVSIIFIRIILLSWRTAKPLGFSALVPLRTNHISVRKKKKSSFSLILLLHEWIVQITIGCSPFQPIGEKRMKSWRISSAKSFKWEGCYEQKPLETCKKMENPFW